jgi:hypothetical protein
MEGGSVEEAEASAPEASPDGGCEGASCCDGPCEVVCDESLHKCGSTCTDLSQDPQHCGSCETVCDPGKLCQDGHCVIDCGDKTRCGDTCVDVRTDVNHCGDCNKACPAPTGAGKATCQAKQCVAVCDDGEPACGNACCKEAPPNTVMVCKDGKTCASQCLGVTASCGGTSTMCASWDFESGTTEGVIVDAVDSAWDGRVFASTTQRKVTGLRSLAISVDVATSSLVNIRFHFCDSKDAPFDTKGYLGIHANVRVDTAVGYVDFDPYTVGAYYSFYDGLDGLSSDSDYAYPPPGGMWTSADMPFQGYLYDSKITDVILHVNFPGPPWKGTVYVDDVRIF